MILHLLKGRILMKKKHFLKKEVLEELKGMSITHILQEAVLVGEKDSVVAAAHTELTKTIWRNALAQCPDLVYGDNEKMYQYELVSIHLEEDKLMMEWETYDTDVFPRGSQIGRLEILRPFKMVNGCKNDVYLTDWVAESEYLELYRKAVATTQA